MRVAVVSDIHGNLTAFEAVLADLRASTPDMILHGGDLAYGGSSPREVIDRIRDLGWPGVVGNADEMLYRPASLADFGLPEPLSSALAEMASWASSELGEDRLNWLRELPLEQTRAPMALVHASPDDLWRAPQPEAADAVFDLYLSLNQPIVVYGHIHRPYVRQLRGMTVANSGAAGIPYDGDTRASYLLIHDGRPTIRRVTYDVDREVARIQTAKLPHAGWVIRVLASARPQAL